MKRLASFVVLLIASFILGLAVPSGQVHAMLGKALSLAGLPTTTQQVDISVIRTVTIPKGYRCSLSNADTVIDNEFGNFEARGCILDSTAIPFASPPAAMSYVFRQGNGPWYSPSSSRFFLVRWSHGQLQMVEIADACLCGLGQDLTIRYQAVRNLWG